MSNKDLTDRNISRTNVNKNIYEKENSKSNDSSFSESFYKEILEDDDNSEDDKRLTNNKEKQEKVKKKDVSNKNFQNVIGENKQISALKDQSNENTNKMSVTSRQTSENNSNLILENIEGNKIYQSNNSFKVNKFEPENNTNNYSQESPNKSRDSKHFNKIEEKTVESNNTHQSKNSKSIIKKSNPKQETKESDKDFKNFENSVSVSMESRISNTNTRNLDKTKNKLEELNKSKASKSYESEYKFHDNDKRINSVQNSNANNSRNLNESTEKSKLKSHRSESRKETENGEKIYNDFENNNNLSELENDMSPDNILQVELKSQNDIDLDKDSIKDEKSGNLKNDGKPLLSKKINSKAKRLNNHFNNNNSSTISSSLKYSMNPKFVVQPTKVSGEFNKPTFNSATIQKSAVKPLSNTVSTSGKTLLKNSISKKKTNFKKNNYLSASDFKKSLDQEISNIKNKMEKIELNASQKNNLFQQDQINLGGLNNENNFNSGTQSQMSLNNSQQYSRLQNTGDKNKNLERPNSSSLRSKISNGNLKERGSSAFLNAVQKLEKDKMEYFNNLKKVKSDYEKLNFSFNKKKLQTKNLNNKHKDIINSQNKIPLKYEDIEENKELVRLLLKNPKTMSMEEKAYIDSLSDKEFKRLIEYLKVKSKELEWRGNDLGSGHYNEFYIKIDRNTESYLADRYLKLKNFLKLNFKNMQAEEILKQKQREEELRKKTEVLRLEAKFEGVQLSKDDNHKYDENQQEQDLVKVDAFVKKTKDLMKELDSFKNIILDHKTQMQFEKVNYQNKVIVKDLDEKLNFMREDVKNIQRIQNSSNSNPVLDPDDYIRKIEDFKLKNKNLIENFPNEIAKSSIIQKIRNYCSKTKINASQLINSLNNIYSKNNDIDLEIVKKNLIKFSVLSEAEADFLINEILNYKNESIKADYFICLIDDQYRQKKIDQIKDKKNKLSAKYTNEFGEENLLNDMDSYEEDDLLELYEDDDDYDYNSIDVDQNKRLLEKKKKIIEFKNNNDYKMIIKRKACVIIQKNFRNYCAYKKVKVLRVNKIMLVNRLIRFVKRFLHKIFLEKNNAAFKIQYLLRKNLEYSKNFNDISRNSQAWLKRKDPNRNVAATTIQRYWRAYKNNLYELFYESSSTNANAVNTTNINVKATGKAGKSLKKANIDSRNNKNLYYANRMKLCYICKIELVTHLCRNCSNTLYCEACFYKFHLRGAKRNHQFVKITDFSEEKKKKIENRENIKNIIVFDETSQIKEYLVKKKMDLRDHLRKWDFLKNGTIKYINFKDCISVKFFDFDPNIRKLLLDMCLKYTVDEIIENQEDWYINYEKMCDDLI